MPFERTFRVVVAGLICLQGLMPLKARAADGALSPTLASDPDCMVFLETRTMIAEIKAKAGAGELLVDSDPAKFHTLLEVVTYTAGGTAAAGYAVVLWNAGKAVDAILNLRFVDATPAAKMVFNVGTKAALYGTFATVAGSFLLMTQDENADHISDVKKLLAHPESLFGKSAFNACNDLLEYPQLRSMVEQQHAAAAWVLAHQIKAPEQKAPAQERELVSKQVSDGFEYQSIEPADKTCRGPATAVK